jgi:hypothetical protein
MSTQLENLKTRAAAQVAEYPQYAGHFDGYVLVRIVKPQRTKMGVAFTLNEIAIARPDVRTISEGRFTGRKMRTVWSMHNKIDTSIPASDVEAV